MVKNYKVEEVSVGYHPAGFRIDKTADPMNRYTKWEIDALGKWQVFIPVCFHQLPLEGWIKVEKFNWKKQ